MSQVYHLENEAHLDMNCIMHASVISRLPVKATTIDFFLVARYY